VSPMSSCRRHRSSANNPCRSCLNCSASRLRMKSAAILGASGSVGRVVTQHFSKLGWRVFCLDIAHPPALPPNTSYIPVDHAILSDDAQLHSKITAKLPPLSLVFSVAGGWVGGGAKSSSFCSDVQLCMRQNITSARSPPAFEAIPRYYRYLPQAAAAGAIASKLLLPNGLLVLTGSTAGLLPSSSMIAYSTSKAALHHMVRCWLTPRPSLHPRGRGRVSPGFVTDGVFQIS
jgi:NAD(P)-dependent dehydrogenase (short-subunit alcohol dehydrogenase family)